MAFRDMLNIASGVTITKQTRTADGMGGYTTTAATSTLSLAAIWQANSFNRYMSEKIAKDSTHVLAFETGGYDFDDTASAENITVAYDSVNYRPVGHADDVMQKGIITVIGLERTS